MRRREFMMFAGGAAAAWPLSARAQHPTRIPHVVHFSPAAFPEQIELYHSQLGELGWVEGRNIHFDSRNTAGNVDRLSALAEELVQEGHIDVIVAESTPASFAAQRATHIIPIIAIAAHDPVASGLVKSLARPGGNLTGISFFASETTAKRVELMREVVPRAVRLAVVVSKVNDGRESLGSALEAGSKLGFKVEIVTIDGSANLAEALSLKILSGFDAFVFVPDILLSSHRVEITKLIGASNKPAIYTAFNWVDGGGFMSFGTDPADVQRRVVSQLDRVLKGERPGDLPFERATKFLIGINLPVARRLGIELSPTLLARADKVIE